MEIAGLDFETYWSQTHTLKKMSPIAYVMHPETELISCSLNLNGHAVGCTFGEDNIRAMLRDVDWSRALAVGHNMSVFDALIMSWRLGIRPRMWGCTLAMARPLHAKTTGLSLAALVQHYGLGEKNGQVLVDTRGKHLVDFGVEDLVRMHEYNTADTEQCVKLFHLLKRHYTADELWHIDANIRMLVEPEFELDTELLEDALQRERDQKHESLVSLGKMLGLEDNMFLADDVKKRMSSSAKFSEVLTSRGVEVPMKRSKTDPRKLIPAIAKTDEAMTELLEHEDEVVAAAARARLATKSTQLETRIQSFLSTYSSIGKLPVPAHYCGADTTGRDSGFLYNMYNLPRVNRKKPRIADALRDSVCAPAGKKIVVADSSGIELRVNHTLWQVARSMSLWGADPRADLYIGTASAYYGEEVTKEDPRRQLGKVLELSCFSSDTVVLTDSGPKPIIDVSLLDKVWDGSAWVEHMGVVHRGKKSTLRVFDLEATSDHEILTEHGWAAWSEVCGSSLLQSALRLASSQLSESLGACTPQEDLSTPPSASARADGEGQWPRPVSHQGGARDATHALASEPSRLEWPPLIVRPGEGQGGSFWLAWLRRFADATSRKTKATPTTVAGASPSATSGAKAQKNFSGTSPRCQDGTSRGSTWTAETTTEGTNRETSNSCLGPQTARTGEQSGASSSESPSWKHNCDVYDLMNCGPRQRFTVLTTAGPLIVHNCGFGIGHVKLRDQARAQYGLKLTPEESLAGVNAWRGRYPEITDKYDGGWARCQTALDSIRLGDIAPIDPWGLCTTEQDAIVLPSGRRIRYPDLRQEWGEKFREVDGELEVKRERSWVYAHGQNKAYLYGGKCTENIVQALARDIIFEQSIEFFKRTGLRPKHKVYDELVYLVDDAVAEDILQELLQVMRIPPKWWPQIVLWSEGAVADRYGEAK